jgi:hypothetical protein
VRPVNGASTPGSSAADERVDLRAQQTWFARAVTAPQGDPDAARMLTAGPLLNPSERLQIYRDGYRGRLVECLADDFGAVRSWLGEAAFEACAHDYIDERPSRSPSLNGFGRSMPAFLEERRGATNLFAADLARLEWAIVEAIHAAPSPPLTLDRFEHMTPEQWATARLVPAASVRVLRFAYAANAYYQAFRGDDGPRPGSSSPPDPHPSATLVHRKGWVVWRTDLTPGMARLLESIAGGAPLGEALATSISDEDEGTQTDVTRWFRDWVGGGVFTAVELPAP